MPSARRCRPPAALIGSYQASGASGEARSSQCPSAFPLIFWSIRDDREWAETPLTQTETRTVALT